MSPRGNDAEAAGQELKAKLGANANAEEMIAAGAESYGPELRIANNRGLNQKATDELDEERAQSFVGDDHEVLGYAVRGPFLVVVSSDENGFITKQAFALDEKKAKKAKALQQPDAPEPDSDDSESDSESDSEAKSPGDAEDKSEADARAEKTTAGPGASKARTAQK